MQTAKRIAQALEAQGYPAYIVGGAVRDLVMGIEPKDVDIATAARPGEILAVALGQGWRTVPVGAAFGVIVVIADGRPYEVATFRSESYGRDSHRPESVRFHNSLTADLARRDFTINAMALSHGGEVIDLFGGQDDIRRRVIRTVGNPDGRFAEDGLRMLRAGRFAARLDFCVAPETAGAIRRNASRCRGLSVERVTAELEAILAGCVPSAGLELLAKTGILSETCTARAAGVSVSVPILPELAELAGVAQNPAYHRHDVLTHTLRTVDGVPPEIPLRWAALLHDIAKGRPGIRGTNKYGECSDYGHDTAGAAMARSVLGRLRVAREDAVRAVWLVGRHLHLPRPESKPVLRWLVSLAADFSGRDLLAEATGQLLGLHRADRLAGHVEPDIPTLDAVQALAQSHLGTIPFYPADLALDGGSIASVLGRGVQVRSFQFDLIRRIQFDGLPNERTALIGALAIRGRRMEKKKNTKGE